MQVCDNYIACDVHFPWSVAIKNSGSERVKRAFICASLYHFSSKAESAMVNGEDLDGVDFFFSLFVLSLSGVLAAASPRTET